ncbi:hypothetical protein EYF80_040321 [Liparis tanakae]|uniref:Uncharacterized protein n=1 Tax=Liparis tanakae TaxID=230148 RepID=A0A4Z2G8M6_9TELE|nr:hypothetical protein EYF80_040321 [Liparis tanakae]
MVSMSTPRVAGHKVTDFRKMLDASLNVPQQCRILTESLLDPFLDGPGAKSSRAVPSRCCWSREC